MDARQHLAQRIRDVISVRPDVVEKKLFGGLGWMLQGNMAVGVMSTGGLLVRVEPEEVEALIREPGVGTFGREGAKPMKGFVVVDAEDLSDAELADWVDRGADRALSLPPK
ncbi:MAG TPA: TfoX/Sxy family protein [Solirubrobacteraceae bacterium]|nr:TfoX/Sxy family protein [Solirubrobacteraceae bacterium]